jgi:hypothetical protein
MDIASWAVQVLLAAAFLVSGADGGRALRFGEDLRSCRHRNTDEAITLTLLRNAAGLPLVPPFREGRKPWLKPSFDGA